MTTTSRLGMSNWYFSPSDFSQEDSVFVARKEMVLELVDDALVEDAETLTVELKTGPGTPRVVALVQYDGSACVVDGRVTVCTVTATIIDDDEPDRVLQTAGGATWALIGERTPAAGGTYPYSIELASGTMPGGEWVGFSVPASETSPAQLGTDPAACTAPLRFCASIAGGTPALTFPNAAHGVNLIISQLGSTAPHTATATLAIAADTPADTTITFGPMDTSLIPRAGGMTITVTGRGGALPASNDATLRGLAVNDGTSDLRLTPTFVWTTTSYAALVANTVDQVTVTPATNDDNAEVAYLDASDNELTDADTTADGFQVALANGTTTIEVQVTAADDATTRTYTVTLTRAEFLVFIAADQEAFTAELDDVTFTLTRTGSTAAALTVAVELTQDKEFLLSEDLSHTVTFQAGEGEAALLVHQSKFEGHQVTRTGTLTAAVQPGTGFEPGSLPASTRILVVTGAVTVRLAEGSYTFEEDATGAGSSVAVIATTAPGIPKPTGAVSFSIILCADRRAGAGQAPTSRFCRAQLVFQPSDFSFSAADSVFTARVEVELVLVDDAFDEPDETFAVVLTSTPTTPLKVVAFSQHDDSACDLVNNVPDCRSTVTIRDNDEPDEITQEAGGATWTLTGEDMPAPGDTYTFKIELASGTKPLNEYVGFYLPDSATNQDLLGTDPAACTGGKQFCASFTGAGSVTVLDGAEGHDTIAALLANISPHTATATLAVAAGTPVDAAITFGALQNDGTPRDGGMTIRVTSTATEVTIAADEATVTEGTGAAFTLSRTGAALTSALTVDVAVTQTGSVLSSGSPPSSVTFAAGSADATLTLATDDDDADGDDGTVTVTLQAGSGYEVGTPASAEVAVTDNDVPVDLVLSVPSTVAEDVGAVTVTVTATTAEDAPPPSGTSVPFFLKRGEGTATSGTDHVAVSEEEYLQPSAFKAATVDGQPRYRAVWTYDVTIVNDDEVEADETLVLQLELVPVSALYTIAGGGPGPVQATVTIEEDDPPVGFTADPTPNQAVLTWGHGDVETSLTGHEYRRRTFAAGAWGAWGEWTRIFSSNTGGINFQSFTVSGLDTEVTYGFELRAVDGQAKGVAASAEATTFVPMSVMLCCNSPTTFNPAERLRLTFEFSHLVNSLDYFGTPPVDYEGVFLDTGTESFDPAWGRNLDAGERDRFWNLDVTPNTAGTITVTLQGSSPATRCTAKDRSDKDRFCSTPPDNLPLGETLVVTLPRATDENDATLSALSLGTGVTLSPSFAAGTASYTASVAHDVDELTLTATKGNDGAAVAYLDENDREIVDADTTEEGHQVGLAVGDNVIEVRVTSQDGTMTRTYTVTVTRAGLLPELSVAPAAATEGRDVTFTVTLAPAATEDVTATWTASIGSGDTAVAADLGSTTTGTLTFTAGDTQERFTVATAEDELDEENETFTVTLSSPSSNATLATDPTATGTITDDDDALPNTAPVITTTSPVAVAENGTAVATLAATDADGDPIAWSKTGGADADRFALSAQGVLTFKAEPDYESPADVASADPANDAENNEYVVFVTASDGTDAAELQLVVRVTNANDAPTGTVTIDDTSPMIGDVLTASAAAVADQDGLPDPFAPAWQWYRTPTDGSETEIDRATAATYTVVRADYDATLTAKATWTDDGGFTNTLASAATEVTPRPSCTKNPGDVWCGVVTVEWYEPLSAYGYAPAFGDEPQAGELSDKNFTFLETPYTIDLILVEPRDESFFGGVYFSLTSLFAPEHKRALVLYIGPTSRPLLHRLG